MRGQAAVGCFEVAEMGGVEGVQRAERHHLIILEWEGHTESGAQGGRVMCEGEHWGVGASRGVGRVTITANLQTHARAAD